MSQTSFKTDWVWHNWKFLPWDDAHQHHVTHSGHYGGWVFEWIRVYPTQAGAKIFRLNLHIERLLYSAKVAGMRVPYSQSEIEQACIDLVEKNKIQAGYMRPFISFWAWSMWLHPDAETMPLDVRVSFWKRWKYLSEDSIRVCIPSTRRIHPSTSDMNAKLCGHYANSIQVSLEVHKRWFDEGLLLDTDWYIAEWPGENICFIQWNTLITPSTGTILPGITRKTIMQIAKEEMNINIAERKILPEEITQFDEAFFVWTAAEVTPIASITLENDEVVRFTTGEEQSTTNRISSLYQRMVHGEIPQYVNWLF